MASAQAEQDCLVALVKAAELVLMDMLHTFAVLMHNNKHDAEVHRVCESVHVPEQLQVNYWGYPSAPQPATTTTTVTCSSFYLLVGSWQGGP